MEVTTYSASATSAIIAGHIIRGMADGDDVITVTRSKDLITPTVGIKGDSVISQSTDKSGEITIKLLAGSSSNDFLGKKAQATDAGTMFAGDLSISEAGTNAGVIAQNCVIKGVPDYSRGETAGVLEWIFWSPNIRTKHTGGVSL